MLKAMRGADDRLRVVEATIYPNEVIARGPETVLLEERLAVERIELPNRLPYSVRIREIGEGHSWTEPTPCRNRGQRGMQRNLTIAARSSDWSTCRCKRCDLCALPAAVLR